MHFLRTLFWIIVATIVVLFSANNWTPVTVNLSSSLRLDTQLPVLVVGAFLVGLVPMLIAYQAQRWRFRRRMASAQRSALPAVEADPTPSAPPPSSPTPPPASVPTAVPPGVA